MAQEVGITVGSGLAQAKLDIPRNRTSNERHLRGTSVVVLNPEDNSASIAGRVSQITVAGTALALPSSPLIYRRAISLANAGSATLYIGFDDTVATSNGWPLAAGQSLSLEITGNIMIYGITDGTSVDTRILEVS